MIHKKTIHIKTLLTSFRFITFQQIIIDIFMKTEVMGNLIGNIESY
jgi:hypothetical protein